MRSKPILSLALIISSLYASSCFLSKDNSFEVSQTQINNLEPKLVEKVNFEQNSPTKKVKITKRNFGIKYPSQNYTTKGEVHSLTDDYSPEVLLPLVESAYDDFMQAADEYTVLDNEIMDTVGLQWQLREEYETGKITKEVYDQERYEIKQLFKSTLRDKGKVRQEVRGLFQEYQKVRKETWQGEEIALSNWDKLGVSSEDAMYEYHDFAQTVKEYTISIIDFDENFELGLFEQFE